MKVSRNQQALSQLVAATGISLASARVGRGLREAPMQRGYDTTALPDSQVLLEQAGSYWNSHSIEETLLLNLETEAEQLVEQRPIIHTNTHNNNNNNNKTTSATSILRNTTEPLSITTRKEDTTISHHDRHLVDLGILNTMPSSSSLHQKAEMTNSSSASSPSICRMGLDRDALLPADAYLRHEIETGRFAYSQILFDQASNTVFCNQANDMDDNIGTAHHTYGCAKMHFSGCATVKCNGKESCIDTVIEDTITIECEGYESCRDAHLDAATVDCGGEASCMGATIGGKSYVQILDCHSGESACAYSKTKSVGSIFCTGPLSCYGAEFLGVRKSVTCQGVPHPHNYYMPTCGGGDAGRIEAHDDFSIDVICDGDFACIGNGPNDKNLPAYFGMDVGDNGSLTCGGSLVGNQDGFTFVCKYLDLAQECASYECKEPSFSHVDHAIRGIMIDTRDLQTCSKIFSLDQDQMCTGENEYDDGSGDNEDYDNDDEDDEDEDSNEDDDDDDNGDEDGNHR